MRKKPFSLMVSGIGLFGQNLMPNTLEGSPVLPRIQVHTQLGTEKATLLAGLLYALGIALEQGC